MYCCALLRRAWDTAFQADFLQRRTFAMHLVAREARHGRHGGEFRPGEAPRAGPVDRSYQRSDAAFEVHTMAPQAIVDQHVLRVVRLVQKNARVGGAVGAGLPRGMFLAMAVLALFHHGLNIPVPETEPFRRIPSQVRVHPRRVIPVKRCVHGEGPAVTLLAGDSTMARSMPLVVEGLHFVAPGAALAATRLVVEAGSRNQEERRHNQQSGNRKRSFHEATLVPFHAFSR
jgi:hypothetical protein